MQAGDRFEQAILVAGIQRARRLVGGVLPDELAGEGGFEEVLALGGGIPSAVPNPQVNLSRGGNRPAADEDEDDGTGVH